MRYRIILLLMFLFLINPTAAEVEDGTVIKYSLYMNSTEKPRNNPDFQIGIDDRVEVKIIDFTSKNYSLSGPEYFDRSDFRIDFFEIGLDFEGFIITQQNLQLLESFGRIEDDTFVGEIFNSTGSFVMFLDWGNDDILDRYSYVTNIEGESETLTLMRVPNYSSGVYLFGIPIRILSSDSTTGFIFEALLQLVLFLGLMIISPHYLQIKRLRRITPISKTFGKWMLGVLSPIHNKLKPFHKTERGDQIGKISSVMFIGYVAIGLINSYLVVLPGLLSGVVDAEHSSFGIAKIINTVVNLIFALNILYFTSYLLTILPDFVDTRKLRAYSAFAFISTFSGVVLLNVGIQSFVLGPIRILNLVAYASYLGILLYMHHSVVFTDGALRFTIKPRGFDWSIWYFGFAIIPAFYIEIVYQRVAGDLYPIYMFALLYLLIQNLVILGFIIPDWLKLSKSVGNLKERTFFKVPLFAWEEAIRIKLLPASPNAEGSLDGELKLTQVFEKPKDEVN